MPHERGSSRREGAPPQTPDAILLDPPTEQRSASSTLGLHRSLEGVYGGQNHAECRSTARMAGKLAWGFYQENKTWMEGKLTR